jgi:hypothetical protein
MELTVLDVLKTKRGLLLIYAPNRALILINSYSAQCGAGLLSVYNREVKIRTPVPIYGYASIAILFTNFC